MPEALKEFMLHRLTGRVLFLIGSYVATHAVSLLALPKTQAVLVTSGVSVTINDPDKLRAGIQVGLMIVGEFVYHFLHTKFILPHVQGVKTV